MAKFSPRIAIIGAGISGLSVAEALFQRIGSSKLTVTLIADNLSTSIVSYVAAGIFFPHPNIHPNKDKSFEWASNTFAHFKSLVQQETEGAEAHGVKNVRGFIMDNLEQDHSFNRLLIRVSPIYRQLSQQELHEFAIPFSHGYEYETYYADPHLYLPYLMKRFIAGGGIILERHVDPCKNTSDCIFLRENFDVIINCTGLASATLFGDHLLTPIRGQTLILKGKHELNKFYRFGRYYVYPSSNSQIICGGVKQFDDYNQIPCPYDRTAILENCTRLLPWLRSCSVIDEKVGLRPFRTQLRLEIEKLQVADGGELCLIHNYGHGGNGYTYSFGCALEVVELVKKTLNESEIIFENEEDKT